MVLLYHANKHLYNRWNVETTIWAAFCPDCLVICIKYPSHSITHWVLMRCIWNSEIEPSLVQVMACHLSVPSHNFKQLWFIINQNPVTHFNTVLFWSQTFSKQNKMHLNLSSANCQPFCLSPNVLNWSSAQKSTYMCGIIIMWNALGEIFMKFNYCWRMNYCLEKDVF